MIGTTDMATNYERIEQIDARGYITEYSRWDCDKCGAEVRRYRGQGDAECVCGAQYNASGQRLRDDWRDNRSNYDDDVSDMDGFEESQLRNESE